MKNSKIKLFIVTHKDAFIPDRKLFYPIQVGCAFAPEKFNNMIHDDTGDNISDKNGMYCELTAQYWAWKNENDSDYIGFFHYRRYFNFGADLIQDSFGNIVYNNALDDEILSELGIDDTNMKNIICQNDIIVTRPRVLPAPGRSLGKNVYEEYIHADGQYKADLDLAVAVLLEKYPVYKNSVESYLKTNKPYECNMFIMRTELFKEYASWLFDILFEVEKRSDFSSYNQYELRVMGFLAERLFGIWFVHNRDTRNLKARELQKTVFNNTEKKLEITTEKGAVVAVLACNDAYVPYLAALLCSIVKNAVQNRKYELYVLTTDISPDNQTKLRNLVEGDSRFSFRCINIKNLINNQKFRGNWHISVETFYRFYILSLFKNTDKVLYLDCDMIVEADIADLYDTELKNNYLAAVKDIDFAGTIKHNAVQKFYLNSVLGITSADAYFQAGVLLFNLNEMRKKADIERLIDVYNNYKYLYMDQDILNYVYGDKVLYLNQTWNCIIDWRNGAASRMDMLKKAPYTLFNEYLLARKNPNIIHYAGFQKPWNSPSCDFGVNFWKYARQTEFYETLISWLNLPKDKILPKPECLYFEKCKNKKVIIYGTGINASRLISKLQNVNIVGILDRDKQNGVFDAFPILTWDKITPGTADILIIASSPKFYQEIGDRIALECLERNLTVYTADEKEFKYSPSIFNKIGIYRFIGKFDIVSFSIFEALFSSKETQDKLNFFNILNENLQSEGFVIDGFINKRLNYETQLEIFNLPKNLNTIYKLFQMDLKLDDEIIESMKWAEYRVASERFAVRYNMINLLRSLLYIGKTVYLVDSFYPAKCLQALLKDFKLEEVSKIYSFADEKIDEYFKEISDKKVLHINTGEKICNNKQISLLKVQTLPEEEFSI